MEKKISEILKTLTLEEKVNMLHGVEFFKSGDVSNKGIPSVVMSDGPMGVRNEFPGDNWIPVGDSDDYVSYLPSNSALAATWNVTCAYETGKVLGEEARGRGKDIILAPGINIKRDPLCGRNFEYMSEDPYLVTEFTVPFIKGVQTADVAACVKHFAVNSQETNRLWVDTIIDERSLHEIYLPAFKAAVQKANTYSLMNAYNKVNGEHCSESQFLLNKILREQWKYDGTVVSDWGSVHTTKVAAESSLDMEMSVKNNFDEYYFATPLLEAVKKGEVKEKDINQKIKNILRMMFRLKMIGEESLERKKGEYNTQKHRETILNTAQESLILLKNESNLLPIRKERIEMQAGMLAPKKKKIAVIGCNANQVHSGGGGSAEIKALYEKSPLLGLKERLGGNVEVIFAPGYYIPGTKTVNEVNWQETSLERQVSARALEEETAKQKEMRLEIEAMRKQLREEAISLAKEADEVIFVGGLNHDYDVEGWDRENMILPYAQDELISALLEVNENTIITIISGSPVEMPWCNKAKAILWSYYAGMETGTAFAQIIVGDISPSGKLPETFPKQYSDTVTYKNGEFGKEDKVIHEEGIFVGYRYYEKEKIEPAFAFGHGLSYSTFICSNCSVNKNILKLDDQINLDEEAITIAIDIQNEGKIVAKEVIQCYVTDEVCTVERPKKELKGFQKVSLMPGEKKSISIPLSYESFAFYSVEKQDFIVEPGSFLIQVGTSSDKMISSIKINIDK